MDRNSPEYRRLERLATVLVYTLVVAAVTVIAAIVYALIGVAVSLA